MTEDVNIRFAEKKDIPFLSKMILLSESTGFELVSYRSMFNLDSQTLECLLEKVLDNEEENHPLSYKAFIIAEVNNQSAATIAAYVENHEIKSNLLTSFALLAAFSKEELHNALEKKRPFNSLFFEKQPGSLQLDSVATLHEYRNKGLFKRLLEKLCTFAEEKHCKIIELQVWKGNLIALKAYEKAGFKIINEIEFPSDSQKTGGRLLLQKTTK